MFESLMSEIASKTDSPLLEQAKGMEKITDVRELDKPITDFVRDEDGIKENKCGLDKSDYNTDVVENIIENSMDDNTSTIGDGGEDPGTGREKNFTSESVDDKVEGTPLQDLDRTNNNSSDSYDGLAVNEVREAIKNKLDGLAREKEVAEELKEKYPTEEGYQIIPEAYLRDKDGNIVKDPVTGEARRVDFMVVKDGKVVDSIEVTSKTADKTEQTAKEERIREAGGNYIRDNDGDLVEIPPTVHTRIERRD